MQNIMHFISFISYVLSALKKNKRKPFDQLYERMSYMSCCLLYMSCVFQQKDKSLATSIIKDIVYFILFIKHILSNLWIQKQQYLRKVA